MSGLLMLCLVSYSAFLQGTFSLPFDHRLRAPSAKPKVKAHAERSTKDNVWDTCKSSITCSLDLLTMAQLCVVPHDSRLLAAIGNPAFWAAALYAAKNSSKLTQSSACALGSITGCSFAITRLVPGHTRCAPGVLRCNY